MTAQHQIDAVFLEDRQGVLAHLDQPALDVGIVRTLGVGRMVPIGDDPVLIGRHQVVFEPRKHGAARRVARPERVEHDEVDVGVVERIVGLGARRQTARLAGRRQREDVVIRRVGAAAERDRLVVVAARRPYRRLTQDLGVHVEDGGLVLVVRAVVVGVVAEHQPQIGRPALGRHLGLVGVAHGHRVARGGARITDRPDACRLGGADDRRRDEAVGRVAAGVDARFVADVVIVARIGREPGQRDLVLGDRAVDIARAENNRLSRRCIGR